jgi:hypothetical protein
MKERKLFVRRLFFSFFGFLFNLFIFYYYWKKNNIQILSKMGFLFFPSDGNYYYTHTQKIHRLFMMIVLLAVESLLEISPRSEGKFLFIQDESRSTFVLFFRWEKKRKTIGRFFVGFSPLLPCTCRCSPFFHRKGGRTSSSSFFFSLGSFREIEDAERLLRGVSRFHQLPLFSPSSSSVCAKAITIIASKLL